MRESSSFDSADETMPVRVLELRVRNHPGLMAHITGLFARRGHNLEAILCAPDPATGGRESTILLAVTDVARFELLGRQLEALRDVIRVSHRSDVPLAVFSQALDRVPRN